MRIFVKHHIYDLQQIKDTYNNFDSTETDTQQEYVDTYSNGGNLFFAGGKNDGKGDNPPQLSTYTPKDYSYLFSKDYQLQQQAKQIQKHQDNTKVVKKPEPKPIINNSSYRKSLEGNLDGKEKELYLREKEKTSSLSKSIAMAMTSKGLNEVDGFKPIIKGFLNKPDGHYVGYWTSEGEGTPYLDGYGPDNLFFMTVPHLDGWNLEGTHNLLPRYDDYLKSHYPNEKLVRTYSINTIEDNENSKPPYYFEPDTNIASYESFPPMNIEDMPIISSGHDRISYFMDDDNTVYKRVEDIYKYHPKDFKKTWGDDITHRGSSVVEQGRKKLDPFLAQSYLSQIDKNGHPFVYTTKWNPTDTLLLDDNIMRTLHRKKKERRRRYGI